MFYFGQPDAGPMSLDGQFSVSESGAATYTIPIAVPPGTGGVEPKLALTYNSQTGNGLLGMGWSLSGLSAVTRCPRTLAQDNVRGSVNFDSNDRYCLDGQRLLAINGTYGADGTEYRTERESYSKIVSYGSAGNGPAWFKVWTKAGQVIEYGNTADSRIEAIKAPNSTATWPTTTARLWAINKVADTKGNYLTYSYTEDQANGDYYPTRIDYTGNSNTGLTPNNSVQFVYEVRPDSAASFHAGSLQKSTQRLLRIEINASSVMYKYLLAYLPVGTFPISRIYSVGKCNASGSSCVPAVNATWSNAANAQMTFNGSGGGQWTGYNISGTPLSSGGDNATADFNGDGKADKYRYQVGAWNICLSSGQGFSCSVWAGPNGPNGYDGNLFGDFNGDGKTDIATYAQNGNWQVCLSNGSGFTCSTWAGTHGASSVDPVLSGDFNGDGLTDIARYEQNGNWKLCYSTGSAFSCDAANQAATYGATSIDSVVVADFDGDGKSDLARYEQNGNWKICLKQEGSGFTCTTWSGPYGNNSADKVAIADFNGDHKADIGWYAQNGNWLVCLSTGVNFSCSTFSGIYGATPSANSNVISDFNLDGRSDMARYDGNGVWNICLSTGNNFVCSLASISYTAYSNVINAVSDLNGDGRPDFISYDHDGLWTASLGAGNLPEYIVNFETGIGAQTGTAYKPLTQSTVYSKDSTAAYPTMDLQSPMYVVSSVSSSNGIGGTVTTNYKYGGLKAEIGTGRGLLGFRWMESTQAETGIITRTEYRQDWPYVGLPSIVKKSLPGAGNNGLLSQVANTYSCLNPQSGSACTISAGNRYFPYLNQSVESSWDMNGTALPIVTTTHQFDAWGNATQVTVGTNDGYSKTTTNQYSNDATNWYLGRLTRSQVQSVTP